MLKLLFDHAEILICKKIAWGKLGRI